MIIAAANQKDGVDKTKMFRREISLRLAEQKTILCLTYSVSAMMIH